LKVPLRSAQFGKAKVAIFADKQALYDAGADVFFRVVRHSLTTTGICNIALSGGSTPKALFALIADRVQNSPDLRSIDWDKLHFFFGDERSVPPDHADSNYGMVRASLLKNGAIPESTVHRVHAERSPAEAADEYERELREHFNGDPKFDLIFLGMGPDGHTASLFPDTPALNETERFVVANHVPKFNADRITVTYLVLNAAQNVLFLVAGEDKQHALKSVLVDHQLPASKVQPAGELMWYADAAAAALLPA
jgi:6-phosphogluconolactonase